MPIVHAYTAMNFLGSGLSCLKHVSANHWLRGIKTYRLLWYLTRISANHALSNWAPYDRITFTVNGNNDHVTMLTLYKQLPVFSFSVKLSSFALAIKIRIILHYSPICVLIFSRKHIAKSHISVCHKSDS